MDKRLITLIGAAVVAGGAGSAANATPDPSQDPLRVASYADLLEPIPNASAVLHKLDAARDAQTAQREQVAQYYYHDHHHHHHSNFYRRYRGYDGYHHHHHSNYYRRRRDFDGYGHHHHHHNSYYRY